MSIGGISMAGIDAPYPMGESDWFLEDQQSGGAPVPGGARSVIVHCD